MVLLRLMGKIATSHMWLHFLLPLVVGILTDRLWFGTTELFSIKYLPFFLGVFVTYFGVVWWHTYKELAPSIFDRIFGTLDDDLNLPKSYFGVSTIPVREYFDPILQVFLARLFAEKHTNPSFSIQRILLFSGRWSMQDISRGFGDGYYAKRLAQIHKVFNTPLGYLERKDINSVIAKLSRTDRHIFCDCKVWLPFKCPDLLLKHAPLSFLRLRRVIFALLVDTSGNKSVLVFEKKGYNLTYMCLKNAEIVPYEQFVDFIRSTIFNSSGELKKGHDLTKFSGL